MRHQKGMDRAEAVMDQMEIKKARSFVRAKVVKDRRVCYCYGLRVNFKVYALTNNI